jgi:hypothetical protein
MPRRLHLKGRRMKQLILTVVAVLPLLSGSAAAQTSPEQSRADCPPATPGAESRGTKVSVDRGLGKGKIEIQCAAGDDLRRCIELVLPEWSQDQDTTVVYATTSIKCGNTIYEVSTGNNAGNCSVAGPENGPRESAGCNDAPSGGNSASANCTTGCGATTGSGSCTIKSAQ